MPSHEVDSAFPASGRWTRQQTMLAFYFYCQTPFGKLHGRNPDVIALAQRIHRTPSALAMKCCNIASLDPAMHARGVAGLGNASAEDRHVWDEFHADWQALALECERMLALLPVNASSDELVLAKNDDEAPADFIGRTRAVTVEQRIGQQFFRRAVLSSYGERCCVSGVSDRRFLVASHIVAWSEDAAIRLHPGNGLCLSAIHDKAFDKHLFSLTDDHRVVLSAQLRATKDEFLQMVFWPADGKPIALPDKFTPEPAFIRRHHDAMLAKG